MWLTLRHALRRTTIRKSLFYTSSLPRLYQALILTTKSLSISPNTLTHYHFYTHSAPMSPPRGTIVFNTVGRTQYGFDVCSVDLNHHLPPPHDHRLTDGISINFNAQFVDDQNNTLVFVSERIGSPSFYLTRPENKAETLPSVSNALFQDRPTIRNGKLYFASTHEQPDTLFFKSWSAFYSTDVNGNGTVTRLTPHGVVDYSPYVSLTKIFIAVASYGSHTWRTMDFRELETEIMVFEESNPENRVVVSKHSGGPTWSQDSTIFFHRNADDGWRSIFRVDLSDSNLTGSLTSPIRITPPGLRYFTPCLERWKAHRRRNSSEM